MGQSPRKTSFYLLVLIVMGSCIGSGIFVTPSSVAAKIGDGGLLLLVWVVGGLITLSGALTYGELAGRYPQAGGVYAYLREAYGGLVAFLFGWVVLMAVTSGAIAGLALVFAKFLNFLVPLGEGQQKAVAVAIIVLCTTVNATGAKFGQRLTGLVTTLKVGGIAGLIIAGLAFANAPQPLDLSLPPLDWGTVRTVLQALVGVYWAYGGWQHLTYLSGEMPDARRKLSWAMVVGVVGVMAAYVSVNMAYMHAMPYGEMAASEVVAADLMKAVFGDTGGSLLAGLVCLSVLGSVLIYTMSAPRIYFAMAADGVFFPALARVNARTGTPVFAIVLQSAWAIVLLFLWGTFGNLVDFVTYPEAVFLVMAAAAVYLFRFRERGQAAAAPGFRVPGYPVTPLPFILVSLAFVVLGMVEKPDLALASAALLVVGVLLFFVFKRMRR